jgi:WD40-like Beta Propeller Repeat
MTRTKIATARQSRRVQHLLCWACIPIVLCAAGLQNVAARNSVSPFLASYGSSTVGLTKPNGSVRSELVRLQAQTGLTIGWYEHDGPEIVKFGKRIVLRGRSLPGQSVGDGTISRDGTQIALQLHYTAGQISTVGIIQADGSNLREFPNVEMAGPRGWSYDMSQLAMVVLNRQQSRLSVNVLDLDSKSVADIAVLTEPDALTTQCWSPDGKEIVYATDGHVTIQNLGESKATTIAVGTDPTWSPDGNWIAYLDEYEHSYYVIRPSGEGKKKLFHNRHLVAGLSWSPDSRIVAYVVEEGFLFMDVETYRLRVRRLQDDSDDWIANSDLGCCENLQWVTNPRLLEQVKSEAVSP